MNKVLALLLLAFVFAGLADIPARGSEDDCAGGTAECDSSNSGPGSRDNDNFGSDDDDDDDSGSDDEDDDSESSDDSDTDLNDDDSDFDDDDSDNRKGSSNDASGSSSGVSRTSSAASVLAVAGSGSSSIYPAAADPSGEVMITDDQFTPATYTIAAGGTVHWRQQGDRPHTVTADDGSFDSGMLNTGQSFSRQFETPGTFAYFCELHGGSGGKGMAGKIVVTAAGAATTRAAGSAPQGTSQAGGHVGAAGSTRGAPTSGTLPKTGVAVGGMVLFAAAGIGAGLLFMRRGRKAE